METVNDRYFNWLCRTCMCELVETTAKNEDQQRQWQSIFVIAEECGGTQTIAELLSNTIPQIDVNLGDSLSKKICSTCLKQLTSMHRFQQMCIQSERELREMIAIIDTTDIPAEEQELFLPREKQTSISDPLQNIAEAHEDVNNFVKNEPCDDNDEFAALDNYQEAQLSTINVEEKILCFHDSWVCERERPGSTSGHVQAALLDTSKHSGSVLRLQRQEEVVTGATSESSTFVCALCKKEFKKQFLLKRHLKRHDRREEKKKETLLARTARKVKACNVCEKIFGTYHALRVHKKREHFTEIAENTKKRIYSCEICKKNFEGIGVLNNHKRIHTDKRPYVCPECGKSFSTPNNLRQHRIRHRDVKRFECPVCPARFHCKGDIIKHKITHEAIKRYMCDICGESFARNNQLTSHKRYHSGEKHFKCDYCEMRFVRPVDKRRHMLTHTGEKPYKCKYCERAFAQCNDHVKHLRTHLGENIYWCTLCPSTFRFASERRAHFVTHKNDGEETRERNMKALKEKEAKLQLKVCKNEAQQPLLGDSKQQVDPKMTTS